MNNEYFVVINGEGFYNVRLNEIVYFENQLRKIRIVHKEKNIYYYDTFESLKKYLNPSFYQCHRSYIINLSKVYKITHNEVSFYGTDITVPVSKNKKNLLLKKLIAIHKVINKTNVQIKLKRSE